MPQFLLHHSHDARDCPVAVAAWRGFRSALRGTAALSSCRHNGHQVWFVVDADNADGALALLPPWIGSRTRAVRVDEESIP